MPHSPWTRRNFLKTSAGTLSSAALMAAVPAPLLVRLGQTSEPVPPIRDERIKAIALAAVETAKRAGAQYADVRLTHTYLPLNSLWGSEEIGIGVRALVGGYWGFACSPTWSAEEASRLAQAAVDEARYNATARERPMEFVPTPAVTDQHWETPITVDPFKISRNEIDDFLRGIGSYIMFTIPGADSMVNWSFQRQEKAFASTEGSYWTQRNDEISASISVEYKNEGASFRFPFGDQAAAGWEYVRNQESAIRADIREWRGRMAEEAKLPWKTMDSGRYDVVFDAYSVGGFLGPTIGIATELDRAMGYEANAGGTSYLTDPLNMLGSYAIGTSQLTVRANRLEPHALATTPWDDDGAVPTEATLVNEGILSDFLTTRETASWIKSYYAKRKMPLQSHGYAAAMSAMHAPVTQIPNLVMQPGAADLNFDTLIADIPKGLAVRYGGSGMDFQQRTGLGGGLFYEVRDGKRVARVRGLAYLFRAPEPWKNVSAIGGARSAEWSARSNSKGEPRQSTSYSISAVPMTVRDFTFIDPTRRG